MQILLTKPMPVYVVCYCYNTDCFSAVGIYTDLETAERIKHEKNMRLGRDYIDENGNVDWGSDDIDEYYFVNATTLFIGDQNENN